MSLQSSQYSIGQSFTHWLWAVNKDQVRVHLVFRVLGWGECLSSFHPTWIHSVSMTWAPKAEHPQGVYSYMEGMQKENNYSHCSAGQGSMTKDSGKGWKKLVDPFPPTHGQAQHREQGSILLFFPWDFSVC